MVLITVSVVMWSTWFTYQIIGPQVVAKPKMKNAAMTIIAVAADSVFEGVLRSREKWPTLAKMRNIRNIHVLPTINDLRRP